MSPAPAASWISPALGELTRRAQLVLARVTPDCNLHCSYCSAGAAPAAGGPRRMSATVLRRGAELLVGSSEAPEVQWHFVGGEPLLLPASWFRAACDEVERVARARPRPPRVTFAVQTNAVPLSDEHLAFFVERSVGVSASLDGTPEINDLQREHGRRALANIRRLVAAGVSTGVVTILTPDNVDHVEEILDFFVAQGIPGMRINTAAGVGRGRGRRPVSGTDYARAMATWLRRVARTGRPVPWVDEVAGMLADYLFSPEDCVPSRPGCYGYQCAGGRSFFEVGWDGSVHPCSRAADAGDYCLFRLDDEVVDLGAVHRALERLHHKDLWYLRCFRCPARRMCTFGCPAFEQGHPEERDRQCEAVRALHEILKANPGLAHAAWRAVEAALVAPAATRPPHPRPPPTADSQLQGLPREGAGRA